MSGVSQKTREYWVAKARGWAERLSGPQDDEFNAVMDDIMLSASRAEAAENVIKAAHAVLVRQVAEPHTSRGDTNAMVEAITILETVTLKGGEG